MAWGAVSIGLIAPILAAFVLSVYFAIEVPRTQGGPWEGIVLLVIFRLFIPMLVIAGAILGVWLRSLLPLVKTEYRSVVFVGGLAASAGAVSCWLLSPFFAVRLLSWTLAACVLVLFAGTVFRTPPNAEPKEPADLAH
jgi:hypothetical protein